MSILIKGMEMPKNCLECTFYRQTDPIYDYCCISSAVPKSYVPKDCPLIEVPEPSDIRPIKGFDMSRGTVDMQTGIFYPAEKED